MVRDPAIPPLVSVTDAAEVLGVSRTYVKRLVAEGELPAAWAGKTMVLAKATMSAFQQGQQFSYPHTLDIYRYDTNSDQCVRHPPGGWPRFRGAGVDDPCRGGR